MKSVSSSLLDASAISLSGLCLIHCLALPLVAALSPALAAWAGAEWVHGILLGIAAPLSALALQRRGQRPSVIVLAICGLALLALGAVGWPSGDLETEMTVVGGLILAAAHVANWRARHAH